MGSALFISPHLDDAAFSCGGTAARLASLGWSVVISTVFTASVPDPRGFALTCQTDKGIPASVDYMALRRAEDSAACAVLGARETWLDLPEAPHRGYESPPELFSGVIPGDEVCVAIEHNIANLVQRFNSDLVFVPQGLGGHVDHIQVVEAVGRVVRRTPGLEEALLYYRDTPYAMRDPEAAPALGGVAGMEETGTGIRRELPEKLRACEAYSSQLGFQFGGVRGMREALEGFALSEGVRLGLGGPAETYLGVPEAIQRLGDAAGSERSV